MDAVNTPAEFEIRSFTRFWDNRGTQKIWPVPGYAHAPFLPNFQGAFVRMEPVNIPAKFEVRSFTRSWGNSDCSFGVGLRTPNLGEEEAVWGRGWYRSKSVCDSL